MSSIIGFFVGIIHSITSLFVPAPTAQVPTSDIFTETNQRPAQQAEMPAAQPSAVRISGVTIDTASLNASSGDALITGTTDVSNVLVYIGSGENVRDYPATVTNGRWSIRTASLGLSPLDAGTFLVRVMSADAQKELARGTLVVSGTKNSSAPGATTDYTGAWFKISYPADFTVRPITSPQQNVSSKPDEATFVSPDGAIEFFVYSPQWSGDPIWYLNQQAGEQKKSDTTSTEKTPVNSHVSSVKVSRWITFVANDGSYTRALVSIKGGNEDSASGASEMSTHMVFGIKYKNQAAYDKYLQQYLAFKKSLVQYAD